MTATESSGCLYTEAAKIGRLSANDTIQYNTINTIQQTLFRDGSNRRSFGNKENKITLC